MKNQYRIKLNDQRIIGPLFEEQVLELYRKERINLSEKIQKYPDGDWLPVSEMPQIVKYITTKDSTIILQLDKVREQIKKEQNEKKAFLDDDLLEQHQEFRPGEIREKPDKEHFRPKGAEPGTTTPPPVIGLDKTVIREFSGSELEKTKLVKREDLSVYEDGDIINGDLQPTPPDGEVPEEKSEESPSEPSVPKVSSTDETQILVLDKIKKDLLEEVKESEKKLKKKDIKAIDLPSDSNEENGKEAPKKNKTLFKIILGIALALAVYEIFGTGSTKKESFSINRPEITYPVVYQQENKEKSEKLEGEGDQLLFKGDYLSVLKASLKYRESIENWFGNNSALGKLIYTYGALYRDTIKEFDDSRVIAKLIQLGEKKTPSDMNYVIGAASFYNYINRPLSAKVLIERFLKFEKKISSKLLQQYMMATILDGDAIEARNIYNKLEGMQKKDRDVYIAMSRYKVFVNDYIGAKEILKTAAAQFKNSILILDEYAEIALYLEDFETVSKIVQAMEILNADNSVYFYSKYLKFKGVLWAINGDSKKAFAAFKESLKIKDDEFLRIKLEGVNAESSESKLGVFINENKAIQLIRRSKLTLKQEDLNESLKSAILAVDTNPDYYPAIKQLSIVQRRRGHFNNAIEMLKKYIAKNPTSGGPQFDLVETFIDANKFEDAKKTLAKFGQVTPIQKRRYSFLLGKLHLKQRNSLPAINSLRKALNEDPLNDRILFLLAEIYLKGGKPEETKKLINKAIELNPGNVYYRSIYGEALYEIDGTDTAIGYIRSILPTFNNHARLVGDVAKYYFRSGQIKFFNEQLEKLKTMPNKNADLFKTLFESAMLEDDVEKIIKYGTELMTLSPGDLEFKISFAEILIESKNYDRALDVLVDVKNRLDTFPRLYYLISKIYLIKGDNDKALEMALKESVNNPNLPEAFTLLGDIYLKVDDLKQAKASYEKAQSRSPEYYDALYGLGYVYFKLNDYEMSLQLLQKANQIDPNDPFLARQMGYVFLKMGQRALAKESFNVYLKLAPDASDKAEISKILKSL